MENVEFSPARVLTLSLFALKRAGAHVHEIFKYCITGTLTFYNSLQLEDLNEFIVFLSLLFTIPQCRAYTSGTYNPNARESIACRGEQQTVEQNTRQKHKGGPP